MDEVARFSDVAMYLAKPISEKGEPVTPRVTLVSMTRNPLCVMAAAAELYRGNVVHDPADIPMHVAKEWLWDMQQTRLTAPLEFIDLHFLIEGVTRAFTHQLVRQRTAVYVQESLRFAVKDNAAWEVALPPSLIGVADDDPQFIIWHDEIARAAWAYSALINSGMPAEDARGLLPTNITTRIHYKTNLRNLVDHAGSRLSAQAQWEWKMVWNEIIKAIRSYGPNEFRWQQRLIADMFRPICFTTGKCEFTASTDRYCVIRDRVQAHYIAGDKPDTWTDVDPAEVFMPNAARKP